MVNLGPLLTSKMEFFVMIVNTIAESSIADVSGVSGHITVIIRLWLWVTVQMYLPGDEKFLT